MCLSLYVCMCVCVCVEEEQELGAAMTASDHIFLRAKCQMSSLGLSAKVVKASRAVTALDR